MLQNRYVGQGNLIERLIRGEAVTCGMISFERGSELGERIAKLGDQELNQIKKNYPTLGERESLIGAVQRVTDAPAPWDRK